MKKKRIDVILVERGLVESRSQAQRLVIAGQVRADGQVVQKSSLTYPEDVQVQIDSGPEFVSRGGEKLSAALKSFKIEVDRLVCADVGASTGGFTDCLLKQGAARVYAIDVGRGILHWKLRQTEKVVVMEGVNARYLDHLPETIDVVTIDVSFISARLLLPVIQGWFGECPGQVILLIKPQFEAGQQETSRGRGVIREPEVHQRILYEVLEFAQTRNYQVSGLTKSPITGPKGNAEFLAWLHYPQKKETDLRSIIDPLFSIG